MKRIQVVWWGRKPTISFWKYPRKKSTYYELFEKPIFYGIYLGLFEIRFFLANPDLRIE